MGSGLPDPTPAKRALSPRAIPGLHFNPGFRIPDDVAEGVRRACMEQYFRPTDGDPTGKPKFNQVQLFGLCTLSPALQGFIVTLAELMRPHLSPELHDLLFNPDYPEPSQHKQDLCSPSSTTPSTSSAAPKRHRQAILNLYEPGEGITPHVDLENRYGDGIVGVSLGSGCVMNFRHDLRGQHDLYLPKNSVVVMTDEARFLWQHGIEGREVDLVEGEQRQMGMIKRGTRLSITFRWLLPEVVPDPPDAACDGEPYLFEEDEEDESEIPLFV
ncbi:hypothetical protein PUNSTDRAFT_65650 [Punctularia strigosozonata HHB-11173 SS5]|uniref:uncharacterized protein n=1 Tax=Punctularia strigosozonata (strain HHB-11173) TaxID=741275 RepID=UPI0004417479|nr:uncharacterized protein PUNSTDRAFT_65650 [Punctularia strigosozonata HHB-11173 SS5]EIN11036.1 hypothetical protein PUNSTDRAFT_65650 [Punctularia strigosozonata HHB-11173 SS5]